MGTGKLAVGLNIALWNRDVSLSGWYDVRDGIASCNAGQAKEYTVCEIISRQYGFNCFTCHQVCPSLYSHKGCCSSACTQSIPSLRGACRASPLSSVCRKADLSLASSMVR